MFLSFNTKFLQLFLLGIGTVDVDHERTGCSHSSDNTGKHPEPDVRWIAMFSSFLK
jgi:hypothetical protein